METIHLSTMSFLLAIKPAIPKALSYSKASLCMTRPETRLESRTPSAEANVKILHHTDHTAAPASTALGGGTHGEQDTLDAVPDQQDSEHHDVRDLTQPAHTPSASQPPHDFRRLPLAHSVSKVSLPDQPSIHLTNLVRIIPDTPDPCGSSTSNSNPTVFATAIGIQRRAKHRSADASSWWHACIAFHVVLSLTATAISSPSTNQLDQMYAELVSQVCRPGLIGAIYLQTELADALHAVAKQLKDMTEQLLPAVASIAEAVKKKENDEADAMEEELWETTRDTIKDDEQVQIDSWEDELNNLLVFAGLFSAVVTAFTVQSYTWLQQDPGDATNTILAQISLQISSFATAPSFINSSAPALPLQNVTSAFTPAAVAVPVNTLWVLSLTLSLLSAFFAIAVQQWLRQLRLPADIPACHAVELLALRVDGLKTWQVPGIISLLPLLLQVAVVLFLVGLFILLRSLNATVTIAFGIVAGLGLMSFLVSTFIPLISAQCPYKSPLVPTVLIVLQWLSYPLALTAVVFVLPFHAALNSQKVLDFLWDRSYYRTWRFLSGFRWTCNRLIAYTNSFGRHMFINMSEFWRQREYRYLLTLTDDSSSVLRRSSVARVLLVRSHSSFARLVSCMRRFSLNEWRGISQAMVMHSLSIYLPRFDFEDLVDYYGNVAPRAASCVRHWFSSRHFDPLWGAQEARNWKQDGDLSWEDHDSLVLSSALENHSSRRYTRYARHLFHICNNQTTNEDYCSVRDSITPLLILKAFEAGYVPEADKTRIVINFAASHGTRRVIQQNPVDDHAHRMLFASCTAALVAMTHHPSDLQEKGRQVLSTFSTILSDGQWKREHTEKLKAFYTSRPEDDLVGSFRLIPGIHRALCYALAKLARNHALLQDPECPSIRLALTLREIYDGIDQEDINHAREWLDIFSEMILYNGDLDRWKEDIMLEECMQALVRAECEATSTSLAPSSRLHQDRDPLTVENAQLSTDEDARADCMTDRRLSAAPSCLAGYNEIGYGNELSTDNDNTAESAGTSTGDKHRDSAQDTPITPAAPVVTAGSSGTSLIAGTISASPLGQHGHDDSDGSCEGKPTALQQPPDTIMLPVAQPLLIASMSSGRPISLLGADGVLASTLDTSAEKHTDHAPSPAPILLGYGRIQRERGALDAVTRPVAADDPVDPQEATPVASSSMSDEQESEGDNHPVLALLVPTRASSLSQPPHNSQALELSHSASTTSLPNNPSTLSTNPMPNCRFARRNEIPRSGRWVGVGGERHDEP
ncbi:hypothetical protein NM688_g4819 [Phlebia brevispora]|uniref:Uncharacterized protein n=1 Tax=Phlebia brevispora TaxID=194682 RepID=A0ACC1T215_9APHY|nr:hypothetical protein NM688_g4819 [Phlebia brevispora]